MNNLKNDCKLVFLMSFGHSGIDWLHSLLDSHKEILILPVLCFYRSWKLLEAEKVTDCSTMATLWTQYLSSDKMQSNIVTKKFNSKEEIKLFGTHLNTYLCKNGISRKAVLWGVHEAYILSKGNSIKPKTIVMHEHVSFPFKEICDDFKTPNILMIVRDPRASLAGVYRGVNKKYSHQPDVFNYFYNMSTEIWLNSVESYYKYREQLGKNLYIIKNEDMVCNLRKEMTKLSNWMCVKYSKSLLVSSSQNSNEWNPDSCYLKRNEPVQDLASFYSPESVKSRWLSELQGTQEINMIEQMFWRIMMEFNYKPNSKRSFYNKLYAYYSFIRPHRGFNRFKFYHPKEEEINRKIKILEVNNGLPLLLWEALPKKRKIVNIYVFFSSVICQINILFTRDRWSRYDDPTIDSLYRDAGVKK
jgi:hypothetical protein